jgi:hypothetical protein
MTVPTAIRSRPKSEASCADFFSAQAAHLDSLAAIGRTRSLKAAAGLDFSSND